MLLRKLLVYSLLSNSAWRNLSHLGTLRGSVRKLLLRSPLMSIFSLVSFIRLRGANINICPPSACFLLICLFAVRQGKRKEHLRFCHTLVSLHSSQLTEEFRESGIAR